MKLRGYAIPFGLSAAADLGNGTFEAVEPGAFAQMLASASPVVLQSVNHDASRPKLASTLDGTLTLFEDVHGLAFEADLPNTPHNYGVLASIVGGMNRCSVQFGDDIEVEEREFDGEPCRIVKSAVIKHITLTGDAAYAQTGVWPTNTDLTRAPRHLQTLAARWGKAIRRTPTRARAAALGERRAFEIFGFPSCLFDPQLTDVPAGARALLRRSQAFTFLHGQRR